MSDFNDKQVSRRWCLLPADPNGGIVTVTAEQYAAVAMDVLRRLLADMPGLTDEPHPDKSTGYDFDIWIDEEDHTVH